MIADNYRKLLVDVNCLVNQTMSVLKNAEEEYVYEIQLRKKLQRN